MARHENTNRCTLNVTRLEERSLMAGNVFVSVGGGDLRLVGDDADNAVRVARLPGGDYQITGLPRGGADTTLTFNGQTGVSFTVPGVNDDLRIDLRGGSDRLQFATLFQGGVASPMSVPDDLVINTGDGDDEMVLNTTAVGGDASIKTGAGDDDILIAAGGAGGNFGISTGDGADRVHAFGDPDVRFAGLDLRIATGRGADSVHLALVATGRDLAVNTGGGGPADDDTVGLFGVTAGRDLTIGLGGGTNQVIADTNKVGRLRVEGGGDRDAVSLARFTVAGALRVRLHGADDELSLDAVSAAAVVLRGGGGSQDKLARAAILSIADISVEGFEL